MKSPENEINLFYGLTIAIKIINVFLVFKKIKKKKKQRRNFREGDRREKDKSKIVKSEGK